MTAYHVKIQNAWNGNPRMSKCKRAQVFQVQDLNFVVEMHSSHLPCFILLGAYSLLMDVASGSGVNVKYDDSHCHYRNVYKGKYKCARISYTLPFTFF
jgi:hypothetical protein